MSLSQNLSQHWSNNWMLKVINNVMELNGISRIATAGPVVRNDEAVGSIPTSSTILSITCRLSATQLCSILFQRFKLAGSLPQHLSAGFEEWLHENKRVIRQLFSSAACQCHTGDGVRHCGEWGCQCSILEECERECSGAFPTLGRLCSYCN